MKHARPDYARIQDPSGKIPEDEPVFLLRAQDSAAPETVRRWAVLNEERGGDPALTRQALDHARAMEEWQSFHGMKPADGPGFKRGS